MSIIILVSFGLSIATLLGIVHVSLQNHLAEPKSVRDMIALLTGSHIPKVRRKMKPRQSREVPGLRIIWEQVKGYRADYLNLRRVSRYASHTRPSYNDSA